MKKVLLFVTLILYTTASTANDLIELHLGSKHYHNSDRDFSFNEVNPGFGYIKEFDGVDISIGGYHNSVSDLSIYTFIGESWGNDYIKGGVEMGFVTGYRVLDVLPMMVPHIKFGTKKEKLKLRAIPLVVKGNGLIGAVVSLSLEFDITTGK